MNETNISEMRMRMRLGNPGNCFVLRDEFKPKPKITFKMFVFIVDVVCRIQNWLQFAEQAIVVFAEDIVLQLASSVGRKYTFLAIIIN